MVMKYDISVATAPRDVMAFRATEDPILMHAKRQLMIKERSTAGRGMFQPGDTYDCQLLLQCNLTIGLTLHSQLEPGSPRSRANAQICREAVATSLMQHTVNSTISIATMTFVPA